MYCGWGNLNNKWSFPHSWMGRLANFSHLSHPEFCFVYWTQHSESMCLFQMPLPTSLPAWLDCFPRKKWRRLQDSHHFPPKESWLCTFHSKTSSFIYFVQFSVLLWKSKSIFSESLMTWCVNFFIHLRSTASPEIMFY